MTRRMIDTHMWSNENFGEMPMMARLLLIGIINHADDQGRVKAHSTYLRTQIFPYDDVPVQEIDEWLSLIEKNGTIILYVVDGKRYAQLLNWWKYQSIKRPLFSEYPSPNGWQDHEGFLPVTTDYGNDWWVLRSAAAKRDNWQCANCGDEEPLEVHHIIPLLMGGTNTLANLITLCRFCHRSLHKRINREGLTQEVTTWLVADS